MIPLVCIIFSISCCLLSFSFFRYAWIKGWGSFVDSSRFFPPASDRAIMGGWYVWNWFRFIQTATRGNSFVTFRSKLSEIITIQYEHTRRKRNIEKKMSLMLFLFFIDVTLSMTIVDHDTFLGGRKRQYISTPSVCPTQFFLPVN